MSKNGFDPCVSFLEEIADQDLMLTQGGRAPVVGLSDDLGNTGWVCTLTKECQLVCHTW